MVGHKKIDMSVKLRLKVAFLRHFKQQTCLNLVNLNSFDIKLGTRDGHGSVQTDSATGSD